MNPTSQPKLVLPQGATSIGGTANSTPQFGKTNLPTKIAGAVVQGTARELGAFGQKALNIATLGKAPSTVTYPTDSDAQRIYRAIYGTTEPVSVRSVGEEYPFVDKGSKAAPILAVGGFLLNAIPGGKAGLSSLVRSIAKTSDVGEVSRLMKSAGFSEDIVNNSAQKFAQITKEDEVLEGLRRLEELQNSTKRVGAEGRQGTKIGETLGAKERGFVTSVKEEFPQLTKVSGQYIPRSTDALAVKARNLMNENFAAAEISPVLVLMRTP